VRIPQPPLLLITDRKQAKASLVDIAQHAFTAGCRWLSLRERDIPLSDQIMLVAEIKEYAQAWNAHVMLHGSASDAIAAKADGVHLRAGSDVIAARKTIGPDLLLGLSVHKIDEVKNIDPNMVDYVVAGPVFETTSKPGYGPVLGIKGIEMIAAASSVPVIAIGGIDRDSGPSLLKHGVGGLAVMGSVMRAADPAEEIRAILQAFRRKG
jgi:thiamine-phosphate pyrophosphorylase